MPREIFLVGLEVRLMSIVLTLIEGLTVAAQRGVLFLEHVRALLEAAMLLPFRFSHHLLSRPIEVATSRGASPATLRQPSFTTLLHRTT